ncbi:MAG: hypothetical protein KZQ81_16025 [Candidatus Thiodiazotropha sp. (ex Rostrolucina anterorostrata)]|nr:hypothetical protein [Candidatus Thiodiazotropha sp. (ex Rostrolucina anterorostrata)]
MPYALLAGKGGGGMGGSGGSGEMPDTVEGPLNDKMSDQGKLYGDLYKILRYQGTEVDAICGEPVLSEGYAQYALEESEGEYVLEVAPYHSQCVQPVADYAKWGEINGVTGLTFNRLPLVMTYDATWERTECEVGELLGVSIDTATGELTYDINEYFIPVGEMWNGVTYCEGVKWVDMVAEVHFGRLNLSRSPEAVLLAAFDEAISAINSEDTVAITRDAAGRLLLEKNVYSETEVDDCGEPLLLDPIFKAIDSPLENLALYVKLIQDGHLVTPGDQRAPIDRSERGGIPLWKQLELTDGPSDALRPTVDIEQLSQVEFSCLVDVVEESYVTYYECYTDALEPTPCLCESVNHDGAETEVACEDVVSRKLLAVETCPTPTTIPDTIPNSESCDEVPWNGIKTDDLNTADSKDFAFAAAFLAAAADKTGEIGPDMVVYINSILGINKVVGYSDYNSDGTPTDDAVDYSSSPVYYNFGSPDSGLFGYSRVGMVGGRGNAGSVKVLQDPYETGTWSETSVDMLGGTISWRDKGVDATGAPDGLPATDNILGFTQMADDDLSIIEFIHTYQIPGLR